MAKYDKDKIFQILHDDQIRSGIAPVEDKFLRCPLCWVDWPVSQYTQEHIVPESLGGVRTTLTCCKCNSTHGSFLDAALKNKREWAESWEGLGKTAGRMTAGGRNVGIDFSKSTTGYNIEIVGKQSDPSEVKKLRALMKQGRPSTMALNWKLNFSPNRIRTAHVRCAYLALFRYFGYSYLANPLVQQIRVRISDLALDHPDFTDMVGDVKLNPPPLDYFMSAGHINNMQFVCVFIRLMARSSTHGFVLMPGPTLNRPEFFDALRVLKQQDGGRFDARIKPENIFW